MAGLGELVRWETVVGQPVTVGEATVTPEASVLTVRLPGRRGGFVWNRPAAVTVARKGQSERIPVVDVTRVAQVSLLVAAAAVLLIMTAVRIGRKE